MGLQNPLELEARTWINEEMANATKLNTLRDDLRKLRAIGVAHYTTVNGTFVNTIGTQQAIDDAIDNGQDSLLYFPAIKSGPWIFDDQLTILGAQGLLIMGDGLGSVLSYVGATGSPGDRPLFYFGGCRNCTMQFLRVQISDGSTAVDSMFVHEQDGLPGSGVSTMFTYRGMLIEGWGALHRGIYFKGDETDANNDFNNFDGLFIGGYNECAVELRGANCMHNVFENCQLAGQRTGNYGVKATVGVGGESGMFTMRGGACLSHLLADFYVQNIANGGYSLYHVRSEGSEALWEQGSTGSLCSITFDNVRYSNDQRVEDNDIIKFGTPGPIKMANCTIGTDYSDDLRIRWQFTGGFFAPSFVVEGCRIYTEFDTIPDIFVGTIPNVVDQTYAQHSDTVSTELFRRYLPNDKSLFGRNAANTADLSLVRIRNDDGIEIGEDNALGGVHLKGGNFHDLSVDCGIRFPGTQVASADPNTLDDYEEGLWTPGLGGGADNHSYTSSGSYVKIGKFCIATGRITYSTLGTMTQLQVNNMPFTADNVTGARWPVLFGLWQNFSAAVVGLNTVVGSSAAGFDVLKTTDTIGTGSGGTPGSGGAVTNVVAADMANNSDFSFTIVYRTLA